MKKLKYFLLVFFIIIFLFFSFNFFYFYKLKNYSETEKHLLYKNLDQVDERLKKFAIKIEDKRFYHHFGVDFLAILRALKEDLFNGKKQGASTIDQQVVKLNEENFYKRGIKTKIGEIFKAVNLNFHYKKDDILLYWINNVYFPYGVKGFKSACKIFFEKDCSKLFDSELLFLFAMYQTGKNPYKQFSLIKQRSKILCNQLNLDICKNIEKLPPISKKDIKLNLSKLTFFKLLPDYVKARLDINQTWQNKIEQILKNTKDFRQNKGIGNCCVLIMDKQGKIKTMATCSSPGTEEKENWINPCLVKRQTGSAIKPFVYYLAMKKLGYTGGTILEDKPIKFILDKYREYLPRNFDMKYHGKVSLAQALGSSLNIPAVETLHKLGVKNFIDFINNLRYKLGDNPKNIEKDKLKYTPEKLGLSVALGTYEMSVFEFTNLWRFFVLEISDDLIRGFSEDKIDYRRIKERGQKREMRSEEKIKNEILDILSDNKNRLLSFPLENNLDMIGWAVKTGTSRHFVDGRTCGIGGRKSDLRSEEILQEAGEGNLDSEDKMKVKRELGKDQKEFDNNFQYSPLVVCVWVGNLNSAPTKVPGSEGAGFIWNLVVRTLK